MRSKLGLVRDQHKVSARAGRSDLGWTMKNIEAVWMAVIFFEISGTGWATKIIEKNCEMTPAHPSRYFMIGP